MLTLLEQQSISLQCQQIELLREVTGWDGCDNNDASTAQQSSLQVDWAEAHTTISAIIRYNRVQVISVQGSCNRYNSSLPSHHHPHTSHLQREMF